MVTDAAAGEQQLKRQSLTCLWEQPCENDPPLCIYPAHQRQDGELSLATVELTACLISELLLLLLLLSPPDQLSR